LEFAVFLDELRNLRVEGLRNGARQARGMRVGGQGINSRDRFGSVDPHFKVEGMRLVAASARALRGISQNEPGDRFALLLRKAGGVDADRHGHGGTLLEKVARRY
jgi:hypothetical protein